MYPQTFQPVMPQPRHRLFPARFSRNPAPFARVIRKTGTETKIPADMMIVIKTMIDNVMNQAKTDIITSLSPIIANKPAITEADKIEMIRNIIIKHTGKDPCVMTEIKEDDLVMPRQLLMYFLRVHLKLSLRRSGEMVGKDHATVVYAKKCVKKFCDIEPKYNELFLKIAKDVEKII
jgi:chromosomal replication initiation ATPase DnaA